MTHRGQRAEKLHLFAAEVWRQRDRQWASYEMARRAAEFEHAPGGPCAHCGLPALLGATECEHCGTSLLV